MAEPTARLPALARRTIPVAVPSPVQFPLSLRWEQPVDRDLTEARDPEPVAPAGAVRRAAA